MIKIRLNYDCEELIDENGNVLLQEEFLTVKDVLNALGIEYIIEDHIFDLNQFEV